MKSKNFGLDEIRKMQINQHEKPNGALRSTNIMSNVNVEKMEMTEDLEMVEEEMPNYIKYLSIIFKNRSVFQ